VWQRRNSNSQSGIEKVFVNGVPVIDGDHYDPNDPNASAGQVLRS